MRELRLLGALIRLHIEPGIVDVHTKGLVIRDIADDMSLMEAISFGISDVLVFQYEADSGQVL